MERWKEGLSMLEMVIDSIRVSLMNYQRVVVLRAKDTNRYLPIWIGPSEAESIAMKLQDVSVPRPLTHDLLRSVISTLGATISRVVVSDLSNDTFFAKIVLDANGTTMEIDSRPSDALSLAVRSDAPIFVDDGVVEKAGVQMDEETGKPLVRGDGEVRPVGEEELKSMSAFTDFIETLNLDDLGREQKPPATSA
jgi:bifunctional DNase/RNase